MEQYIRLINDSNPELARIIRDITRKREDDVSENNNLPNVFISGRRVDRVPTSTSDVVTSDNINDFSYDATTGNLYILGDNAGTAEWRVIQLSTF